MDVDVQNYQIICESQFIIQLQISRYAWGVPLITLSDNGDFTVIRSRGWSRLANGRRLEVYYFANNSLLTWDKTANISLIQRPVGSTPARCIFLFPKIER